MTAWTPDTLALLAGIPIGIIFFGGLWWTVQKAMSASQPGLLFATSLLVRTILTLAAFYLIGGGSWQRLVASLIGFMLGRTIVKWFIAKQFSQESLNPGRGLLKEGVR